MQLAAIAMLVANVMLTNATAESDPSSSARVVEPKVETSSSSNSIAAAVAAITSAVTAAQSLDVLEQPADNIGRTPARALMEEICSTLETAAADHELPVAFFARLIWQESRFKVDARSRVGASGIAQFMPATAVWRGLADPLDPIASLRKSADYLRELRNQFGNLGLAAAAYNGGSGRVQRWLDGRGGMPRETRDYVRIVTGSPIEEWRAKANATVSQAGPIPQRVPCPAMVAMASASDPDPEVKKTTEAATIVAESTQVRRGKRGKSTRQVQVAGNVSKGKVRGQSRHAQRGIKSVQHARQRTVGSRRAPVRGRTAMNDLRIERRAARL